VKATYEDHMGTDLSVVNAAKVSFGKRSEWETSACSFHPFSETRLSKKDQGLIQFLARGCTSGDWDNLLTDVSNGTETAYWQKGGTEELESVLNYIRKMPSHWSPFAHTAISLHLKMPIFVARQIMKHTTGLEYNEVSRRYVDSDPEFYLPDVWRKKADNVKQGSSDEAVDLYWGPEHLYERPLAVYKRMLETGVAPEQARMVLPQSMYTEVIATGNLYAIANMYIQRTDSHAQKETQDLAKQIGEIVKPLYPVSWAALVA
jgi:thymidylate synthase (FAD)